MFPLALMALAGFAGYQYAKAKHKDKNNSNANATAPVKTDSQSVAEKANVYNYYTNDSTNGNTLFNGQTQKKRTVFGNDKLI